MSASRVAAHLVRAIAIALALFHLYAGYAGTFYPYIQRAVPVMLATILTFLTVRARASDRKDPSAPIPIYDWILAFLAIPSIGFVAAFSDYLTDRWPLTPSFAPTTYEIALALIATVLLLEACRRVMGPVLVVMVLRPSRMPVVRRCRLAVQRFQYSITEHGHGRDEHAEESP